jgi:hypothetical protein
MNAYDDKMPEHDARDELRLRLEDEWDEGEELLEPEWFADLLDERVSDAERARYKSMLAKDANLAAAFAEYCDTVKLLGQAGDELSPCSEGLRERIHSALRKESTSRMESSNRGDLTSSDAISLLSQRRKRWALAGSVAVLAASILLLVSFHGLDSAAPKELAPSANEIGHADSKNVHADEELEEFEESVVARRDPEQRSERMPEMLSNERLSNPRIEKRGRSMQGGLSEGAAPEPVLRSESANEDRMDTRRAGSIKSARPGAGGRAVGARRSHDRGRLAAEKPSGSAKGEIFDLARGKASPALRSWLRSLSQSEGEGAVSEATITPVLAVIDRESRIDNAELLDGLELGVRRVRFALGSESGRGGNRRQVRLGGGGGGSFGGRRAPKGPGASGGSAPGGSAPSGPATGGPASPTPKAPQSQGPKAQGSKGESSRARIARAKKTAPKQAEGESDEFAKRRMARVQLNEELQRETRLRAGFAELFEPGTELLELRGSARDITRALDRLRGSGSVAIRQVHPELLPPLRDKLTGTAQPNEKLKKAAKSAPSEAGEARAPTREDAKRSTELVYYVLVRYPGKPGSKTDSAAQPGAKPDPEKAEESKRAPKPPAGSKN